MEKIEKPIMNEEIAKKKRSGLSNSRMGTRGVVFQSSNTKKLISTAPPIATVQMVFVALQPQLSDWQVRAKKSTC